MGLRNSAGHRFTAGAAVVLLGLGGGLLAAPPAWAVASDLTISATSLAFPNTPVGDLSSTLDVTITNNTAAPITAGVGGGSLAAGTNFIYDGENCPTTLNPGDSCAASYQFSPKSVGALSDTASLMVQGQNVTIRVSGKGIPDFSVSPTALVFPDTVVGYSTPMQSVVLTNVSSQAHTPSLAGGALFQHTDFASDGQTCGSVPPGGTCAFRYHFAPTKVGALSDGTTIGVDGINYPITLAGKGITGLDISPTTLSFPDTPVGSTSSVMDVTITNVSTQTLTPGIGGGALTSGVNFVYDGENCPTTLAPGAACQASYQFAPKSAGKHTDTATLMVAGGTVTITLVGGHDAATTAPTTHPVTTHPVTTHPTTTQPTTAHPTPPTTTQPATGADSTAGLGDVRSGTDSRTADETDSGTGLESTGSGAAAEGADSATPVGVALTGATTPSTSSWLWVWIAVAVVAVAGIGVGAYVLGRRRRG